MKESSKSVFDSESIKLKEESENTKKLVDKLSADLAQEKQTIIQQEKQKNELSKALIESKSLHEKQIKETQAEYPCMI